MVWDLVFANLLFSKWVPKFGMKLDKLSINFGINFELLPKLEWGQSKSIPIKARLITLYIYPSALQLKSSQCPWCHHTPCPTFSIRWVNCPPAVTRKRSFLAIMMSRDVMYDGALRAARAAYDYGLHWCCACGCSVIAVLQLLRVVFCFLLKGCLSKSCALLALSEMAGNKVWKVLISKKGTANLASKLS